MVKKSKYSSQDDDQFPPQDAGSVEVAAPDEPATTMAAPPPPSEAQSDGEKKVMDRSNPPHYMIMGTSLSSGNVEVVAEEPTIGRIAKTYSAVKALVARHYKDLYLLRIKRLDMSELDRQPITRQRN